MLHFAHGCGAAAAALRAGLDQIKACASPSAAREERHAPGVAQERLAGEESKERAHGNPPFLSAAPRPEAFQKGVGRMTMYETFRNQ